jgi:hypothetical protein
VLARQSLYNLSYAPALNNCLANLVNYGIIFNEYVLDNVNIFLTQDANVPTSSSNEISMITQQI